MFDIKKNMILEEPLIIDNCIPVSLQDEIESMCKNSNFMWSFWPTKIEDYLLKENSPVRKLKLTDNSKDGPQWAHEVYYNMLNPPLRDNNTFLKLYNLLTVIPFTCKKLIRMKVNMRVNTHNFGEESHCIPHVDISNPDGDLITAVYYVNDCDGPTILFNEKEGHRGELSIKTKVSPKKGRMLIFNGKTFHAANEPRGDIPRYIININIIPHINEDE